MGLRTRSAGLVLDDWAMEPFMVAAISEKVSCVPTISVVLPCRNAERYIERALESILAQTYRDYELLVIDNASTDATPSIVSRFEKADDRVRYLRNEHDLGIAGSLNRGLRAARGEFVARMDADDIAEPRRFEAQLDFMRKHPECILCGCDIILIDKEDRPVGRREFPRADAEIKKRMLMEIPFCHPATLFRRGPVVRNAVFYEESWKTVEDRDFWIRLSRYGRYANVPEPLLRYRVSETSMKYAECRRTLWDIVRLQVKYLREPRFRELKMVFVIAAECALLLLPRGAIVGLYRMKYRI